MAKLTLSIDERVIANGKQYAKKQGRTLSSIVEDYLSALGGGEAITPSPSVRALMGIGRGPADENAYRRHLVEKYQ
ncbi:DUF6364 family protein [Bifidobacterium avesanii]|uniref:Toxin-antitoxin system protein n=1 Tax=Bifidobacterium avesanii TaxID=1798157 RepID=A0A7K3TIK0_9BIFI|nr:DUF6364 family protein [Bifidobacterium avesanii]KAB8294583.1 toxin-antitoxin system protein [Bifidobacterium avesanii]NEG78093.1 toxin-antitoxin system protein [Bifidobacterium avesanii]